MATAAELRAYADQLEVTEGLERDVLEAKAAFGNDRLNEEKAAAYRAAVDALAAGRRAVRETPLSAVDTGPGSVTLVPSAVNTIQAAPAPAASGDSTPAKKG